MSGPIPAELGALSTLRNLALSHNQLSGPIPAELGGKRALSTLYLRSNDAQRARCRPHWRSWRSKPTWS